MWHRAPLSFLLNQVIAKLVGSLFSGPFAGRLTFRLKRAVTRRDNLCPGWICRPRAELKPFARLLKRYPRRQLPNQLNACPSTPLEPRMGWFQRSKAKKVRRTVYQEPICVRANL